MMTSEELEWRIRVGVSFIELDKRVRRLERVLFWLQIALISSLLLSLTHYL